MEKFFKNLKETDKLRLYLGLGLLTFIIHNNLPYIKLKLSELRSIIFTIDEPRFFDDKPILALITLITLGVLALLGFIVVFFLGGIEMAELIERGEDIPSLKSLKDIRRFKREMSKRRKMSTKD